jgi:zinc transporter ZupT
MMGYKKFSKLKSVIKEALPDFLFNFNMAYLYSFIAGILVSLAANIFTTALLTKDLPLKTLNIYLITLTLFVSSCGAFGVSTLLEIARREWESEGGTPDPVAIKQLYREKGKRKVLLRLYFLIIFLGPLYMVISYLFT